MKDNSPLPILQERERQLLTEIIENPDATRRLKIIVHTILGHDACGVPLDSISDYCAIISMAMLEKIERESR